MSLNVWRARLSEGWCPRPEHGQLRRESNSGSWCVPCRCSWFLRDGVIRATSHKEFQHGWEVTVTEENSAVALFEVEMHSRQMKELWGLAHAGRDLKTGRWVA